MVRPKKTKTIARSSLDKRVRQLEHDLGARVKELTCIYGLSALTDKPRSTLDEILQGAAELIPPGWLYPEITCARIILEGQEFKTENFRETPWKLLRDLKSYGKTVGTVGVYLVEEREEIDEGPFLKEERYLLNVLAERLGHVIEQKRTEKDLQDLNVQLENRVAQQTRSLLELSTPVIRLWDEILLVPLVGVVDTPRAQQIIEHLLEAIGQTESRVAVVDVTGVPVIDTRVAQHLLKTVTAARMMGTEIIITGISPSAAQTMTKVEIDLARIRTRGTLRTGVAEALALTGKHVASR